MYRAYVKSMDYSVGKICASDDENAYDHMQVQARERDNERGAEYDVYCVCQSTIRQVSKHGAIDCGTHTSTGYWTPEERGQCGVIGNRM